MQTRTSRVVSTLQTRVNEEALESGSKLGTLKELGDELQVSRTVIREAVAILQSQGVLEMRHGVGVFVANHPVREHENTISIMESFSGYNGDFMDFLELRMAFEVHAAGLAAVRKSWAQEEEIWKFCLAFEAGIEEEEDALDQLDFNLHAAIARATNNRAFVEFFDLMGAKLLPQPTLRRKAYPSLITPDYLSQTVTEHRKICEAITAGDAEKARESMKSHLSRSHQRYRGSN
ncbi:FadR/GntR family transcriptional regulator [Pararhodobacter oceanensis]|uniref:FadR family transcriptional regulator n=1 Tax=Pararhodobacter oceanensis TaxID=2172121 RepID=A0A2T8HZK1_9RHOB|nr:FadR/GntR family transcriptional regulator [Pararhodobacter oceanensis]PVH30866.1 FadR family transcriptional regulator [Pararhodobacter oceanensis]